MIKYTIPGNTVSKSNSYRIVGKRLYKTKAVKEYEAKAVAQAIVAMQEMEPMEGDIRCTLHVFFKDQRRRDIDNVTKSILDSGNEVVYIDDSQIAELHIYKRYCKENPRVEVEFSII